MECISLCAYMERLIFVLCQPVYFCIEPSLDFFLEIFDYYTISYKHQSVYDKWTAIKILLIIYYEKKYYNKVQ